MGGSPRRGGASPKSWGAPRGFRGHPQSLGGPQNAGGPPGVLGSITFTGTPQSPPRESPRTVTATGTPQKVLGTPRGHQNPPEPPVGQDRLELGPPEAAEDLGTLRCHREFEATTSHRWPWGHCDLEPLTFWGHGRCHQWLEATELPPTGQDRRDLGPPRCPRAPRCHPEPSPAAASGTLGGTRGRDTKIKSVAAAAMSQAVLGGFGGAGLGLPLRHR